MVLPVYTMRGDLTGTAFGGAPSYTDYTAYVITGPDGAPVDITGGRQDNRADVPPGIMTFILNNTDGRFTTGASAVELDHIFNFRVTANASTYDLFTGYVTSVEPTWPGGVQSWSIIRVRCVDVTGKLSEAQPLQSMVMQETIKDAPTYLFPLNEPSSSTSSGDLIGGTRTATPIYPKTSPGTVEFGVDVGFFDGDTGISITQGTPGAGAAIALPRTVPSTSPWMFEFWMKVPAGPSAGQTMALFAFGDVAHVSANVYGYPYIVGTLYGSGLGFDNGQLQVSMVGTDNGAQQAAALTSVGNLCDGNLHHVAFGLAADQITPVGYVDGIAMTPLVSSAAISFSGIDFTQIGGYVPAGTRTNAGSNFVGSVALAAYYGSRNLSQARCLVHYQAGVGALLEPSDQRFTRIAAYGGITTTGLPTGQATMGAQKINGKTPLVCLQTVARTESSVCYLTGAGALTFQARTARYDMSPALSLTGDDIAGDLPIRKDSQDFFNELTVERDTGATQRVLNTGSQAGKAGRVVGYRTRPRRFVVTTPAVEGGSFNVAPSTDDDAYQNASWQVAIHSQSRTRLPSLEVDLLSRSAVFQSTVLALGMSSLVSLGTLPSQAPSANPQLFIEGWHYIVSAQDYSVEFFTSPQTLEGTVGQATASNSSFSATDGSMLVGF